MEDPLNPYESPVIPAETKSAVEPLAVIANFEMDTAGLWRSACLNQAPTPGWVHWCAPLFIILFGFVCIQLIAVGWGMLGLIGAGGIFFLGLFAVQFLRNRRVAKQTLAVLRAHPLLGATGSWKLTIDRRDFILETPGGRNTYSREATPYIAVENQRLVIWFEPHLPIVIPEEGSHPKMGSVLRTWLWKTAKK